MELAGILAPLTTPFAADGSIALDKFKDNIVRYNRTKLTGYVATGSTGESVLLRAEEIDRVWSALREAAAPGKVLIAGTGVDSTAETIARTRQAAELGYHAALVKTPHYFKPQMTAAALEEHYRRVADASPIPILIYSVPQFTGISVTADLVARLAEHRNIAGIKDSSGNVSLVAEIVRSTPPGFRMLSGYSGALLDSLAQGAAGAILGLACFLPDVAAEIYEAWIANDRPRAARLQQSILSVSRAIMGELGPAGVKYGMDLRGYFGGAPRPPLLPLTDAQKGAVELALAEAAPAITTGSATR